jgi:site-specific recombinase XerD
MLLDEYIQNFLIYLQTQRRYSERTVITYRKSLEKYLATINENAPLEAFSEMNVKAFVWDLKIKQKLAPTSIC